MDRRVYGYIEKELFDYEQTLKLIKELEDDITSDAAINYDTEKMAATHKIGHPTEDKAIQLITNKQLDKAKKTIEAINKAKNRMSEDEVRLFELRYVNGYSWQKITSSHMVMSDATYRRKKGKIIEKVAMEMGFMGK